MRRCVCVILFTCVFIFTSSYSHWEALDSQYCPVSNSSGIHCVNRTLNFKLCISEETMEGKPKRIDPPVNSENMLYLVGYSSGLERPYYACVKSSFLRYNGSAVIRKLLIKYTATGNWSIDIPVRLEASSCSLRVNVTPSCDLTRYTEAKQQYLLLSYNYDSMVLSELYERPEQQPLCSLWAKKDYIDDVPLPTYNTFKVLCKDPKNFTFPRSCV
ncbi:hypothetical protein MTO96_050468 [Rhipicephalus appendiculatus]